MLEDYMKDYAQNIQEQNKDCKKKKTLTKWQKIYLISALCFIAGLGITSTIALTVQTISEHNAVGGLEISGIPAYFDDINQPETTSTNSENIDTDELSQAQALLSDGEENQIASVAEDTLLLTYETYRVKSGDMIGFIADKYDVTQDTIISINNIKQSRLIQPGQYLKIPSMPGILYSTKKSGETAQTIAEKYNVDAQKTATVNNVSLTTELESGVSLFIPDAQLDWATRQEINGDLFRRPLKSRYYLSSYYGWRDSPFNTGKRSFHTGVDMACSTGTPIYPSMDGIVTAAGYNSTYGNYVIVQHHSGYKTLYGHMSKITCKKGNFVYTTTQIGKVGSTGLSTGPHLHFTVYKNGKTVNPLGLIN